jgi:peptidoglycan/LPS O-acetylase OafA/YrhL
VEGDGAQIQKPGLEDPGKEARARAGIPVVPVFDGYRALAILGVVLLHLLGKSGVIESHDSSLFATAVWGTVGHAIDVLFVVSGFVVFLPTVTRNGDFGPVIPYAIRRAARLFPAYWLILLIMLLLIATVDVTPDPSLPGIRDVILHLFGLQTAAGVAVSGVSTGFGVNPPVWTLSVEVLFYLVLPFVAAAYTRHPLAGLGTAALITLLWNYGFEHPQDIASLLNLQLSGTEALRLAVQSGLQLPSWAFSFGLGMTGAWIYDRYYRDPEDRHLALIRTAQVVSLAGLVVFGWLAGRYSADAPVQLVAQYSRFAPEIAIGYSLFLAGFMVSTALGPRWTRRPFDNRLIRKTGDISYGIYLSHMVFAFFLGSLLSLPTSGSAGSFFTWVIVIVPLSVLYGYLSARFLEQPIRRWARQFGRRSPGGPAAADSRGGGTPAPGGD